MNLRKLTTLTLSLALVVGFVACEEDPLAVNDPTVEAEVNGNSWESNSVSAVSTGGSVFVTATGPNGESITLTIPDPSTAGVKPIPAEAGAVYVVSSQSFGATTGEIVVDATDGTAIEGTFEFTASNGTDTYEVTNGEFDIVVNQ